MRQMQRVSDDRPRQANTYVKRSTTCGRGSMGRAQPSKRSRSAFPRRDGREVNSRSRPAERPSRRLDAGLTPRVPGQPIAHSSVKAAHPSRIRLFRATLEAGPRDRGGAQMRKTAAKAVRTKGAAGRREAALAGSGSGESLTAGMSIIPCALRSAVLLPAVIGIEPARSVLEINASALLRVVFLVIALVAALLGFGGIAAAFAGIAKILFVLFLILFLLSLVIHLGRRV